MQQYALFQEVQLTQGLLIGFSEYDQLGKYALFQEVQLMQLLFCIICFILRLLADFIRSVICSSDRLLIQLCGLRWPGICQYHLLVLGLLCRNNLL